MHLRGAGTLAVSSPSSETCWHGVPTLPALNSSQSLVQREGNRQKWLTSFRYPAPP